MSLRVRASLILLFVIILSGLVAGHLLTTPALAQADTAKHMADHFSQVEVAQRAVIRGVLDEVKEPATWLAEHQAVSGLPDKAMVFVTELQKSARQAAAAPDLATAGQATAEMAAICGRCHAVTATRPKYEVPPAPKAPGEKGHMLEHQFAVDLLYQGLIVPSTDAWLKGAERLKAAPLKVTDLPKDPALTKEIVDFEARVHELATQATDVTNQGARSKIYGELIAGCGTCHALHGRVWGPGLPK